MLIVFACAACTGRADNPDPRHIKVLELMREQHWQEAERLLDVMLEEDPKRPATWSLRASLHAEQKQYEQALADLNVISSLPKSRYDPGIMPCLLQERLGRLTEARACYVKRIEQLAQGNEAKCDANLECVLADLMAEGPDAEARRQRILAISKSPEEMKWNHFLLDGFNRDEYLKAILP
jgi:tetratricopeptide (TPR) repeat protein